MAKSTGVKKDPAKATRTDGDSKGEDRKWTVMVFMGAATVDGNVPLPVDSDLEEMASVGSGGPLNIFVQVHHGRDITPQRGQVQYTEKTERPALMDVPEGERDTANGRALGSFIRWALLVAEHDRQNPYHHTMLVLWGHAYDFTIDPDQAPDGTTDALDFTELSDVLQNVQSYYSVPGAPKPKLDILAFDACDLSTVEIACQLQPFADYLLASEIGIPLPGWPYDLVLSRLRYPQGSVMSPAEFGSFVVRRFCESYRPAQRTVSLTLLDLQRVPDLFAYMEVFALTLASAIGRDATALERFASLFVESRTAGDKPYVDVADLCLNLARQGGDPLVAEAARALGDFLISPEVSTVDGGAIKLGKPFVLELGRNAGQTARLNGVSVYAPHVAPIRDFEALRSRYESFVFAKETRWSDLVHQMAELT